MTPYQRWIDLEEPKLYWTDEEMEAWLPFRKCQQTISILVAVASGTASLLLDSLQSVQNQQYQNWQLSIITNDACASDVLAAVEGHAPKESRISVFGRGDSRAISELLNEGLRSATGDWLLFLPEGDRLHRAALVEMLRLTHSDVDCRFLYFDQDEVDERGGRHGPVYKSGFDRDLLMAHNYIGRLAAMDRKLADETGEFRVREDFLCQWDYWLRATARLSRTAVQHLPKMLHHSHARSRESGQPSQNTVERTQEQVYSSSTLAIARQHAMEFAKQAEVMEGLFPLSARWKYPAPKDKAVAVIVRPQDGMFQIPIILMNAGGRDICLYHRFEGSMVRVRERDGNSGEETLFTLDDLRADVLVFFNAPIEALNHLFFDEIVGQCLREGYGLVTGLSLDSRNEVVASGLVRDRLPNLIGDRVNNEFPHDSSSFVNWGAGIRYPKHGYDHHLSLVRKIDRLPSTFFGVSRAFLRAAGGLGVVTQEPQMLAHELSEKAGQLGFQILYTPYAVATFTSHNEPFIARMTGTPPPGQRTATNTIRRTIEF